MKKFVAQFENRLNQKVLYPPKAAKIFRGFLLKLFPFSFDESYQKEPFSP